jgi:hypothetical protein
MTSSIIWFLTAYYALYGYPLFAASVLLALFLGEWGGYIVKRARAH